MSMKFIIGLLHFIIEENYVVLKQKRQQLSVAFKRYIITYSLFKSVALIVSVLSTFTSASTN